MLAAGAARGGAPGMAGATGSSLPYMKRSSVSRSAPTNVALQAMSRHFLKAKVMRHTFSHAFHTRVFRCT